MQEKGSDELLREAGATDEQVMASVYEEQALHRAEEERLRAMTPKDDPGRDYDDPTYEDPDNDPEAPDYDPLPPAWE